MSNMLGAFNNKFLEFDNRMFKTIAVFAGCDYLPSITGIGIKKAYKVVKEHEDPNIIINKLFNAGYLVPNGYLTKVKKSLNNFYHQLVYDPHTFMFCHLNPILDNTDEVINAELELDIPLIDTTEFVLSNISPVNLKKPTPLNCPLPSHQ